MSDSILIFEHAGTWQVVGIGGAVIVGIYLAWLGHSSIALFWRRAVLQGLRIVICLYVGFLLCGPALQHRQLAPIERSIAVLVDTSESMSVLEGPKRRSQRVADLFDEQAALLAKLKKNYQLKFYSFASQLMPTMVSELVQNPTGERTDIVTALSSLAAEGSSKNKDQKEFAAALVISDGADTEQLVDLKPNESLPSSLKNSLAVLDVPVNTVLVGDRENFVDVAISGVAFDEFAFIRNAVEVDVTISTAGVDELDLPVVIKQGSRNLASKLVRIEGGQTKKVSLRFVPDQVGKFVYRVEIPVLANEMVTENNVYSFVTRIIRDKVRILHVVGRPSWDMRFLREVLKRNPNVDLVSFYILRTTVDIPGSSQNELSLIPFPVTQLFGSELDTFDLVIFQNFNHAPYSVGYYLREIARYVQEGGAFWMIGGDLSFGSGGYSLSPLERILPVGLRSQPDYRLEEHKAIVTQQGQEHPILRSSGAYGWEDLPALGGYNSARSVTPDAQVLLAHPFERVDNERLPILAIREVGRGRSAALLTDGIWRWRFIHVGQGGSPRLYQLFVNNLLRWLIRDPVLDSTMLRSSKAKYSPEEMLRFKVKVKPVDGGQNVQLVIKDLKNNIILQKEVDLDKQGLGDLEVPSPGPGAYVASILQNNTEGQSNSNRVLEDSFVVEDSSKEKSNAIPRSHILKRISEQSDGLHTEIGDFSMDDIEIDSDEQFRVEASMTKSLFDYWQALLAVIFLLGLEWWLRRRWGFA
jgi:uncharacterized membrane protein